MVRVGRPHERSIVLNEVEREELEWIGRSRSASHSLVRRVQITLASADGEPNISIAARLGVSHLTVCHWRKKWFEQGLVGLYGEARPGRPRTHDKEAVAELLRTVLESKPEAGTRWTIRSAAAASGLSKAWSDGCFSSSVSSRIDPRPSSFRQTRCPSTGSRTSSVYISIRRIRPWSYVSTRSRRSRRWTAPGPSCRSDSATSKASPTTMSAMAPRRSLSLSILPTARCWLNASPIIGIRNS